MALEWCPPAQALVSEKTTLLPRRLSFLNSHNLIVLSAGCFHLPLLFLPDGDVQERSLLLGESLKCRLGFASETWRQEMGLSVQDGCLGLVRSL